MRTPAYLCLLLTCMLISCTPTQEKHEIDYTSYVNPFIGTDFTGNTYPGAQAPFGMVQLSPDNGLPGWDRISGYFYPDSTIAGFSHTHLSGTGAGDLYDISFMPVTLPYKEAEAPLGIHSKFSHKDESAHAGYYQVRLTDYNINVELTATERCGIQRYTFPEAQSAIFLNLKKAMNWDFTNDSHIEVVDSVTIQGYRFSDGWARDQHIYFRTRFSKPFEKMELDTTAIIKDNKRIGTAVIARFDFNTQKDEQILVNTAVSGVSMEGAAKNLQAEVPENDFDKYLAETKANWNRQLGKIEIKGTEVQKEIFYTALYHTMIQPNIMSDVNGEYMAADYTARKVGDNETHYTTFSLWDTFRASHPLYTLLEPERVTDFVKSMIRQYEYYGYLPIWQLWGQDNYCMIGNHSIPVITDAILKGIPGIDMEKAYEAVYNSSVTSHPNSPFEVWEKYGFMPENIQTQSVSITLEQAFDDWCVAQLAAKLNKDADYQRFHKRSEYYRNLFHPKTKFFQSKNDKGEWIEPFDPYQYGGNGGHPFTEGNAWQYTWLVPHDVHGLVKLFGNEQKFVTKLDSLFIVTGNMGDNASPDISGLIGQYAHGNEPSHHVLYMYNYVGQPWKGARLLRQTMDEMYKDDFDGLSGNEDVGQMSAWYILSSVGLYQVEPAGGKYIIGSPIFDKASVNVGKGKTFSIICRDNSKENMYIQHAKLNGKPYSKSYIMYNDIMKGGTLELQMGNQPSKWGTRPADRP